MSEFSRYCSNLYNNGPKKSDNRRIIINTSFDISVAHYETLQDKLAQLKDARDALNVLREEHREKRRREQEEIERIRQIQMAQKLEALRQKKQVGVLFSTTFLCCTIAGLFRVNLRRN